MRVRTENTGKLFTLQKPLHKGGEGEIYEVPHHPGLVAKVYHRDKRRSERFEKLRIMVCNPPDDPTKHLKHPSIAWPIELLCDAASGQPVGFVMPRVQNMLPLSDVYTLRARLQKLPSFDYLYLVRTAYNLCAAVRAVHRGGCVIGDLNESNVLVSEQALVTLVDADSFQVQDPQTGRVYRSLVGKPEYTPPELQGCRFAEVDRRPEHDAFALAVLIFRLLMEGFHPFDGVYRGRGEPPRIDERIRRGYFPYARGNRVIDPSPNAPPFEILHPKLQKLFLRCFEEGFASPAARPQVQEWLETLRRVESGLRQCSRNKRHHYWNHLPECPWCTRREKLGGRDPFPSDVPIGQSRRSIFSASQKSNDWQHKATGSVEKDSFAIPTASRSASLHAASQVREKPASQQHGVSAHTAVSPPAQPLTLPLLLTLKEHSDFVNSVAFSPDGQLLASGSDDCTVKLWRMDRSVLGGHLDLVSSVALSPDGALLASGSYDGTIKLWRVADGSEVRTLKGHTNRVLSVVFSPDGQLLASASEDCTIKLWRVADGSEVYTLSGHASWVRSVTFSPDGGLLASGSGDWTIKLWRVADGSLVRTLEGHTAAVESIAFSPDGQLLASGSGYYDRTIRLWRVSDGIPLGTLTGHTDVVFSVAFSPDGSLLASGSWDRTIKLWRVSDSLEVCTLGGHADRVLSVAFLPNGRLLASGSWDRTVKLWHTPDGVLAATLHHTDRVLSVAFSPNGQLLAAGGWDGVVKLWSLPSTSAATSAAQPARASARRQSLPLFHTLVRHSNWVNSVVFSPDGRLLASGDKDGIIRVWRIADGAEVRSFRHCSGWVLSLAFLPDGRLLASGGADKVIRIWQVLEGSLVCALEGHTDWVRSIASSPDGRLLASGGDDCTVKLWRVSDGRLVDTLKAHTDWVLSVAFSPDGQLLASGGRDNTIRIWRVSNRRLVCTLKGHTERVWSVGFSPDGRLLASGSDDKTVRIWQVADGAELYVLRKHTDGIRSVAFSPDGGLLASGSNDHTIRLWRVR